MTGFKHVFLDEYFEPSIGRAVRITVATVVPLIWGLLTGNVAAGVWISVGAQVLTFTQPEGSYPIKLLIMSGGVVACSLAGLLGVLAGNSILFASVLMALLAFLGGFVRHSGPHGPGMALSFLLIYLLCLNNPGNIGEAGKMFVWILTGGLFALVCTLLNWIFIPYSPFRRSVSYTWKAMSDWLRLFSAIPKEDSSVTEDMLNEKELDFRTALSDSSAILSRRQGISHSRKNRLAFQLVELRRIVSYANPAVSSLLDEMEQLKKQDGFPAKIVIYIMENLSQTTHRIAMSIISTSPRNVYAARLSIKRIKNNTELLIQDLPKSGTSLLVHQFIQSLREVIAYLEEAIAIIETMGRKYRKMTFFMRNFFTGMIIPQKIPLIRFEFNWHSFILRFSLRLALAMGIGIAIYKLFKIPNGYWIAMTAMIILQPEFGATMTKAFRRIKGTVLGAIIGSLIFLLPLPLSVKLAIVIISSFLMAYYIQHNYAVAAFFITIMVIALYHLIEPVTWEIGLIRVLNTLGGAGLALLGGFAFFPLWERYRFPALIEKAILANQNYFETLLSARESGEKGKNDPNFIRSRQEAEVANSNAFQSLRRMKEEPSHKQQNNRQLYYIVIGYNIRLTRLLKTLTQKFLNTTNRSFPEVQDFKREIKEILQQSAILVRPENNASSAGFPTPDELIRQLELTINSFTDTATEERQTIKNIYERIAKETVGMYYSIQKIKANKDTIKPVA